MKAKRVLSIATALSIAAVPAAAQYGTIGLYSDATGCQCNITDATPGLVYVWVVHRDIAQGVTGSHFSIGFGGGASLSFVGQTKVRDPIHVTGNLVNGYTVTYGSCIAGGLTIMQIVFFGQAISPTCSWADVIAPPGSPIGSPEAWDCDGALVPATGQRTMVNPDATCECIIPGCQPVPLEASTWGGIKALYQ